MVLFASAQSSAVGSYHALFFSKKVKENSPSVGFSLHPQTVWWNLKNSALVPLSSPLLLLCCNFLQLLVLMQKYRWRVWRIWALRSVELLQVAIETLPTAPKAGLRLIWTWRWCVQLGEGAWLCAPFFLRRCQIYQRDLETLQVGIFLAPQRDILKLRQKLDCSPPIPQLGFLLPVSRRFQLAILLWCFRRA